jgi:transposase
VHPMHAVRPVGCWAPKDVQIAVPQSSGRQRLNIHGAIDLETGQTRMIEAATVNAISMIMLLRAIEAMYPAKRLIHLFVDNARYHHAKLVQEWLRRPGCRITLHFIPTYCPHLDPIERLWGLMHKHLTHNRCYPTFAEFRAAILTFLREEVPRKWSTYCDEVTDNFRVISPKDFRVLA